MKNAEDMSKKKQDRMQKIKQLKSHLSAIQSEIAKHKEQKDECIKFKGFLEKLTPQEWKDQKAEEKRDRKKRWVDQRMSEINADMQREIEADERSQEEKEKETSKGRRRQRREAEEEAKEREREME